MPHKFYDTLGVSQKASPDEIKRAFKKAALQNHPDKGGDPEKFKELNAAYEVLSDESKRGRYDQLGDEGWAATNGGAGGDGGGDGMGGMGGMGGMDASIFEQMFGGFGGFGGGHPFGGHRGPTKCRDVAHVLKISLADAYHGMQKSMKVSIQKTCSRCKENCYACQGRGQVTNMVRNGFMTQIMQRPCDACGAKGYIAKGGKSGCNECSGKGTYTEDKKIELSIPAGVADQQTFTVVGCGEQAVREGEINGDLIFQVQIQKDPNGFVRLGKDLHWEVPMTFAESVIGKKVRVPHFAGEFEVDTCAEFGIVSPKEPYIVPGKGMPGGNLVLFFKISYPPNTKCRWTEEQKEAWAKCFATAGLGA